MNSFGSQNTPSRSRKRNMSMSSFGTPSRKRQMGTPNNRKTPVYGDRFIPNRDAMNKDIQMHNTYSENTAPSNMMNVEDGEDEFKSCLAKTLFDGEVPNSSKILAFKNKAPKPSTAHQNQMSVLYTQNKNMKHVKKNVRSIASTAEKVLDAPEVVDDYYLNIMDWGSNNVLAIALGPTLYLWNAETSQINMLMECNDEQDYITSVKWTADGSHVAVGTDSNTVQIWNVERQKRMRKLKGHQSRVGSLAWNNYMLTTGSRDSQIFNHDIRMAEHHVSSFSGHMKEVCGLAWSPDGTQLASGGNDNLCNIWELQSGSSPVHSFTDCNAAVKALAWSPHEERVLATGGGTADKHIRFYNTGSGSLLNSIDTGSQVSALVWSKYDKEILSGHGFSQNQLCLWKYPTMAKIGELKGHTQRVLQVCPSANGTQVASVGADETLRFWNVWDMPQKSGGLGLGLKGFKASRSKTSLKRNIR